MWNPELQGNGDGVKERLLLYLLVHSSPGCNDQGWSRLKPRTLPRYNTGVAETQALGLSFTVFPRS